jgi:hypothetical protein
MSINGKTGKTKRALTPLVWIILSVLILSALTVVPQVSHAGTHVSAEAKIRYCGTIKYRYAQSFERNGKDKHGARSIDESAHSVVAIDWYVCLLLEDIDMEDYRERYVTIPATEETRKLHVKDHVEAKCRIDLPLYKRMKDVDIKTLDPRFERLSFELIVNPKENTYDIRVGASLIYTQHHTVSEREYKHGKWERHKFDEKYDISHIGGPSLEVKKRHLGNAKQIYGKIPPADVETEEALPLEPFGHCRIPYVEAQSKVSPPGFSWEWDLWRIDESEDCERVHAQCRREARSKFSQASSDCHRQAGIEGTCSADSCTTLECLRIVCPAMTGLSYKGQLDFAVCVFTALQFYQTDDLRCNNIKRQCVLELEGSE